MALAKTLQQKTARAAPSKVIDCAPQMMDGELIATVGTPVITPTTVPPLAIVGLVKNTAALYQAGQRALEPGQGLQLFVTGGYIGADGLGTVYTVTIPFTTDGGQDLDASFRIKVVDDA